jgi:hypothetical protein
MPERILNPEQRLRVVGPLFMLLPPVSMCAWNGDLFDRMAGPLGHTLGDEAPNEVRRILVDLIAVLDEERERNFFRSISFAGGQRPALAMQLVTTTNVFLDLVAEVEPENTPLKAFLAVIEVEATRKSKREFSMSPVYRYLLDQQKNDPEIVLEFIPGDEFWKTRQGGPATGHLSASAIMEMFRLALVKVLEHLPA